MKDRMSVLLLASVVIACSFTGFVQAGFGWKRTKNQPKISLGDIDQLFDEYGPTTDFIITLNRLKQFRGSDDREQNKLVANWLSLCEPPEIRNCNRFRLYSVNNVSHRVSRVIKPLLEHCGLRLFEFCQDHLATKLNETAMKLSRQARFNITLLDKHFIEPLDLNHAKKMKFKMNDTQIAEGLQSLMSARPYLKKKTPRLPVLDDIPRSLRYLRAAVQICKPIARYFSNPLDDFTSAHYFIPSTKKHTCELATDWLYRSRLCAYITNRYHDIKLTIRDSRRIPQHEINDRIRQRVPKLN